MSKDRLTMSKDQALDIIKLLSGVESWSFAAPHRMPDYLHEQLDITQELLRHIVMAEGTDK